MQHATVAKRSGEKSCKKCHADSDCLTCHTMHVHPGGVVGGGQPVIADIIQFFRELDLNELLTADYSGAWGTIVSAVRDPQANLTLALMLFALATLLVTMIFAVLLLLHHGRR